MIKKIVLIPSYEPDNKLIKLVKELSTYKLDIVIINDGSNNNYDNIYKEVSKFSKVISYKPNRGKGYALKIGLKYIKEKYIDNYIVITMDSDGQHSIKDAIKLGEYANNHKSTLILGMRKRNKSTPLRSRVGNEITRFIYKLVTNKDIYDTQTGLRAFSNKLVDKLLEIKGDRYEYEMNVLLSFAKQNIYIKEIEIESIYIDNNSSSHFNTIKDSIRIYKDILKFSISSIISFIIDYIIYSIFIVLSNNIVLSNIIARIISGSINYNLNKHIVFSSKKKSIKSYIALCIIILIINTILLNIAINNLLINKFIAKILVEIILFIFSYIIQKKLIFKESDKY